MNIFTCMLISFESTDDFFYCCCFVCCTYYRIQWFSYCSYVLTEHYNMLPVSDFTKLNKVFYNVNTVFLIYHTLNRLTLLLQYYSTKIFRPQPYLGLEKSFLSITTSKNTGTWLPLRNNSSVPQMQSFNSLLQLDGFRRCCSFIGTR